MTDDAKKTAEDSRLISLSEDYEIRDWMRSLNCTEEELRTAVKAVGNSAQAVRSYLANR